MWMPSPSSYDSFGNMVRYSLYRIALGEFYFNHKKRSLHVNSEILNTYVKNKNFRNIENTKHFMNTHSFVQTQG